LSATQIGVLASGVPAPTGLTATTPTFREITLNWTAPPQAVSYTYRIERRSGLGAFASIGTVTNVTTYVDTTVLPLTTYDYRVIASSVADSGPSNVATAMRTEPPPRTTTVGAGKANRCGCATAGSPGPLALLAGLSALAVLFLRRRAA
jgi:uncharacterized protein (TIGR03382 family)